MINPFGTNRDPDGQITSQRYDSKPTQPKDPGEMTHDEHEALFNATLHRQEVAEMVYDAVIDEISLEQARHIVHVLFRLGGTRMGDFMEAGRLMHNACYKRVHEIVESETHNTVMGD